MSSQQLHSWKEIAGYLGVTPRTAQCWEKKLRLPVHRRPGGPKAPVFALSDELDAWLELKQSPTAANRAQEAEAPSSLGAQASCLPVPEASASPQDDGEPETAGRRRLPLSDRTKVLIGFGAVALAVCVAAVILYLYHHSDDPATAEMRGKLLLVMDTSGGFLWSHTFPEADESFYAVKEPTYYRDPLIVADIDSDGHNEVLFNYKPRPPEQPGKQKLICFDKKGRVRWEFVYGRSKRWGTRELSSLYFGSSVNLVRRGDQRWVMTVAKQLPFFPSQVAFLDAETGTPVWQYWHPGHLSATLLVDLDEDRTDEIVLSGINNPGPGIGYAALVVLEPPDRANLPSAAEWQGARTWGGHERNYVLFPRSRVAELIGGGAAAMNLFVPGPGQLGVGLAGGLEEQRHICWSGIYKLNFKLQVLDFRPHDCFRSTVQWLVDEGKLPRQANEDEFSSLARVLQFKTAPDGNSREVALRWNPVPSAASE